MLGIYGIYDHMITCCTRDKQCTIGSVRREGGGTGKGMGSKGSMGIWEYVAYSMYVCATKQNGNNRITVSQIHLNGNQSGPLSS